MLYGLRLEVNYSFDRPAGAGRQLLRVTPAHLPGRQELRAARVAVSPPPLEEHRFTDFFGTEVIELVLPAGLTEFGVVMTAQVERIPMGAVLDISPSPGLLAAELSGVGDISGDSPHHFLPVSPRIPVVAEISAFAAEAARGAPTLRETVERLGRALHEEIRFDATATEVDTPIAEAFAGRKGVCQDFAQIMIAGLRSLGIPAGYVAGYLRTLPPPGKPRLQGADAMHAWVRAWAGRETGWIEYDATNACRVDADHIVVGYGRDYGDVAPVTGSLRLDGDHTGSHSVDIAEI
ncbi:transglutaminase family protein [Pseudogemmobacter sonorensis]|uniref:transglutaminase family protein n=1 Tax=Pseudogemmobacter sonorensis TaxID=2989681 RepID=UPI003691BB42